MVISGEDFTLVCGGCGKVHSRKLAWVQLHSKLECDGCGAHQPIDKDAAMIELATSGLAARTEIGPLVGLTKGDD